MNPDIVLPPSPSAAVLERKPSKYDNMEVTERVPAYVRRGSSMMVENTKGSKSVLKDEHVNVGSDDNRLF